MQTRSSFGWGAALGAATLAAALLLGHRDARSANRPSIKGQLTATSVDPDAVGDFEENVQSSNGSAGVTGELKVRAQHLARSTSFVVKVGGVPIGTLKTNASGKGRARFRAPGRGRTQPLTQDPRGKRITVTDETGEETLEGEVSDPTTPGGIRCCLNTHDASGDQQGCDSLLPADCTAAGGRDMGAGSCEPDPCPGNGDSAGGSDVGETNDDQGDPGTPGGIRCCLNSGDQQGCDSLSPEQCTAAGGKNMGPGSCEPDPCPGVADGENQGGSEGATRKP